MASLFAKKSYTIEWLKTLGTNMMEVDFICWESFNFELKNETIGCTLPYLKSKIEIENNPTRIALIYPKLVSSSSIFFSKITYGIAVYMSLC